MMMKSMRLKPILILSILFIINADVSALTHPLDTIANSNDSIIISYAELKDFLNCKSKQEEQKKLSIALLLKSTSLQANNTSLHSENEFLKINNNRLENRLKARKLSTPVFILSALLLGLVLSK